MQWFKHDTDANMDAKLQVILLDYGLEGYGLYWYCMELIAGKVCKDNLTFQLEHDARIIARNTGSTPAKVEEMMRKFVELGLFEASSGRITCLKLAKRLDQSMTSNKKMRGLIESLRNSEKVMISHDGVMTESGIVMQEEKRREENTENDRSDDQSVNQDLVKEGFEHFWKVWKEEKKKLGKVDTSPKAQTFEKKWKAMFNRAYFSTRSEQDFRDEVNQICGFCREAHQVEGFNRFENMQTGKFLTEKQWRD